MSTRIILTISDDLLKQIDDAAKEVKVSRTFYITQVLRKHMGQTNIFEGINKGGTLNTDRERT